MQSIETAVVVFGSPPQGAERLLRRDGPAAYVGKSKLGLRRHSESAIQIVKRMMDRQAGENGDAGLPSLDLSTQPQETNYDTRNGI
jgi:hypothetical protein